MYFSKKSLQIVFIIVLRANIIAKFCLLGKQRNPNQVLGSNNVVKHLYLVQHQDLGQLPVKEQEYQYQHQEGSDLNLLFQQDHYLPSQQDHEDYQDDANQSIDFNHLQHLDQQHSLKSNNFLMPVTLKILVSQMLQS